MISDDPLKWFRENAGNRQIRVLHPEKLLVALNFLYNKDKDAFFEELKTFVNIYKQAAQFAKNAIIDELSRAPLPVIAHFKNSFEDTSELPVGRLFDKRLTEIVSCCKNDKYPFSSPENTRFLNEKLRVHLIGASGSSEKTIEMPLFIDIAASEDHAVFLTKSGELYGYGNGKSGQLGASNMRENIDTPVKINVPDKKFKKGSSKKIAVISGYTFVFWINRPKIPDRNSLYCLQRWTFMVLGDQKKLYIDGQMGSNNRYWKKMVTTMGEPYFYKLTDICLISFELKKLGAIIKTSTNGENVTSIDFHSNYLPEKYHFFISEHIHLKEREIFVGFLPYRNSSVELVICKAYHDQLKFRLIDSNVCGQVEMIENGINVKPIINCFTVLPSNEIWILTSNGILRGTLKFIENKVFSAGAPYPDMQLIAFVKHVPNTEDAEIFACSVGGAIKIYQTGRTTMKEAFSLFSTPSKDIPLPANRDIEFYLKNRPRLLERNLKIKSLIKELCTARRLAVKILDGFKRDLFDSADTFVGGRFMQNFTMKLNFIQFLLKNEDLNAENIKDLEKKFWTCKDSSKCDPRIPENQSLSRYAKWIFDDEMRARTFLYHHHAMMNAIKLTKESLTSLKDQDIPVKMFEIFQMLVLTGNERLKIPESITFEVIEKLLLKDYFKDCSAEQSKQLDYSYRCLNVSGMVEKKVEIGLLGKEEVPLNFQIKSVNEDDDIKVIASYNKEIFELLTPFSFEKNPFEVGMTGRCHWEDMVKLNYLIHGTDCYYEMNKPLDFVNKINLKKVPMAISSGKIITILFQTSVFIVDRLEPLTRFVPESTKKCSQVLILKCKDDQNIFCSKALLKLHSAFFISFLRFERDEIADEHDFNLEDVDCYQHCKTVELNGNLELVTKALQVLCHPSSLTNHTMEELIELLWFFDYYIMEDAKEDTIDEIFINMCEENIHQVFSLYANFGKELVDRFSKMPHWVFKKSLKTPPPTELIDKVFSEIENLDFLNKMSVEEYVTYVEGECSDDDKGKSEEDSDVDVERNEQDPVGDDNPRPIEMNNLVGQGDNREENGNDERDEEPNVEPAENQQRKSVTVPELQSMWASQEELQRILFDKPVSQKDIPEYLKIFTEMFKDVDIDEFKSYLIANTEVSQKRTETESSEATASKKQKH